jgi:hypothetical protein
MCLRNMCLDKRTYYALYLIAFGKYTTLNYSVYEYLTMLI